MNSGGALININFDPVTKNGVFSQYAIRFRQKVFDQVIVTGAGRVNCNCKFTLLNDVHTHVFTADA